MEKKILQDQTLDNFICLTYSCWLSSISFWGFITWIQLLCQHKKISMTTAKSIELTLYEVSVIFIKWVFPTAINVRDRKKNIFKARWFLTKLLNLLNVQLGTIKFTHDGTSELENVFTGWWETYLVFNWNWW